VTLLERWLGWAVPATPQERAAALWSFAYFFMLLAGYYTPTHWEGEKLLPNGLSWIRLRDDSPWLLVGR
jgi:hypothetical protein